MYKKLLALFLALVLCVCPVFAVSDTDNSYYAFEPVSYGVLGNRSLATLASTAGWTDIDHDYLNQIRLALTSKNTGTLLSYIVSIKDLVSNSYDKLFDIKRNTDYLPNISNNTNDAKSLLTDAKSFLDKIEINTRTRGWTTDQAASVTSNSSTLLELLTTNQCIPYFTDGTDVATFWNPYLYNIGLLSSTFLYDSTTFWNGNMPSFYGLVHRLQETLASDDDKALADAQKPNRDQIEQDFVSGSSGKTSLGASDFGDLSSVGGSVKDSISLNGQSSISGFTGGLSDSDEAGQSWFSASTRDALDTVSLPSSSSRARRSTDDTYNMAGFAEHYSWLYGG